MQHSTSIPTQGIVEISTFQLKPEVVEADFLESVDYMHREFMLGRPGFIARSLTKAEDGIWRDVVFWESLEAMQVALQESQTSEKVAEFVQAMELSSLRMETSEIVFSGLPS